MDAVRLEKKCEDRRLRSPDFKPWTIRNTALNMPRSVQKSMGRRGAPGKTFGIRLLHLHMEDFTGQYGKFYRPHPKRTVVIEQQVLYERKARELGFKKVSGEKKAVARAIKDFFAGGLYVRMVAAIRYVRYALAAENNTNLRRYVRSATHDHDAQKKSIFQKPSRSKILPWK